MDINSIIAEVEEFNKFERLLGATSAVFSCDYVTYVATLKCGSSFFTATIEKNLRWPKIDFKDIRWDNSHVFSLMLNPLTRRYKAITEWLYQKNLVNLFDKDPYFQKFVLNKPILDIHSYGYVYTYYEEYCQKIDWIPIDSVNSRDDVKKLVGLLFEKNKIDISDFWASNDVANISPIHKKMFESKVKELFEENPSQEVLDYLAPDMELYSQVIAKFNPTGHSWDNISWLRK